MRTIAYIDGYNLYYGCLRGTPYKWLDVVALCRQLVHIQTPAAELAQVKFFTADIKSKFSRHGEQGQLAQQTYHRALEALHPPETLSVIKGYHISEPTQLPRDQEPFQLDDRVAVLRVEEKQTDINIALHMVEDAVDNRCDQMVLLTSDSDLAPALDVVKRRKPEFNLGLVLPRREGAARAPNRTLSKLVDWTRDSIRDEELEAAQMPDKVATHKKPASKPNYW